MDPRTRLFLWTIAGCGFFAALGALFGAVSAVLNRRQGHAAGSLVGLRVAEAFEPLDPLVRAGVIGAADGLTFGAVAGSIVGMGLAWDGHGEWARLRVVFGAGLALVGMAVVFGLISRELGRHERVAVAGLSGGGMAGVMAGFALGGTDGLILGALLGLVAGAAVGVRLAAR
ncbi:MAG: hypothetical protein ACRC33_10455 [Gemmataceae bacterium]